MNIPNKREALRHACCMPLKERIEVGAVIRKQTGEKYYYLYAHVGEGASEFMRLRYCLYCGKDLDGLRPKEVINMKLGDKQRIEELAQAKLQSHTAAQVKKLKKPQMFKLGFTEGFETGVQETINRIQRMLDEE